jgi:hypothetical protein
MKVSKMPHLLSTLLALTTLISETMTSAKEILKLAVIWVSRNSLRAVHPKTAVRE